MTDAQKLQRRLRNFAAIVRRAETGATGAAPGGVQRNFEASCGAARGSFRAALALVVALEDAAGVEAAARYSDRLTELRQRAHRVGLLTAGDVLAIEREVLS